MTEGIDRTAIRIAQVIAVVVTLVCVGVGYALGWWHGRMHPIPPKVEPIFTVGKLVRCKIGQGEILHRDGSFECVDDPATEELMRSISPTYDSKRSYLDSYCTNHIAPKGKTCPNCSVPQMAIESPLGGVYGVQFAAPLCGESLLSGTREVVIDLDHVTYVCNGKEWKQR